MLRVRTILYAFLTVAATLTVATAQSYGDWTVDVKDPEVFSMTTVNDSGRLFGQYCLFEEGSCYWTVTLSLTCKTDHTYPVLANNDSGAVHLDVMCTGQLKDGDYGYVFTNFDQVESIVRSSKQIGFAFSTDQAEFRVVRFNSRGAATALSVLSKAADAHVKTTTPRNTRDKRL